MTESAGNPLSGYFRQPAIYVKLPSGGRWWPHDSLNLPTNQDIPVYPMTAMDEINLRTPDALINGQGVVNVIQSCCPNIRNAWHMPSVDTDFVLIAIRVASYGQTMPIESTCTHCASKNEHEVNLDQVMNSIQTPVFDHPVEFKHLKIKLKPMDYQAQNQASQIAFEEQKVMSLIDNADIDPENKIENVSRSLEKMVEASIDTCASCTEFIELPDGQRVNNTDHIKEFYKNVENDLVKHIQKTIADYLEPAKIKPVSFECDNCNEIYSSQLTFDFANFFGKGF